MELLFLAPELFWSFLIVFLVCEFGEMFSNRFVVFSDTLDRCHWYLFPIELQRIFIIVVANAQRPTIIHAIGNAQCSREANNKVRHIIVKNLMVFQQKLI